MPRAPPIQAPRKDLIDSPYRLPSDQEETDASAGANDSLHHRFDDERLLLGREPEEHIRSNPPHDLESARYLISDEGDDELVRQRVCARVQGADGGARVLQLQQTGHPLQRQRYKSHLGRRQPRSDPADHQVRDAAGAEDHAEGAENQQPPPLVSGRCTPLTIIASSGTACYHQIEPPRPQQRGRVLAVQTGQEGGRDWAEDV